VSHSLALSPGGHLLVELNGKAEPKINPATAMQLTEAFTASVAQGLELLASALLHEALPPTFDFWRGLARRYFTALCHNPSQATANELTVAKPSEGDWIELMETAPPNEGA